MLDCKCCSVAQVAGCSWYIDQYSHRPLVPPTAPLYIETPRLVSESKCRDPPVQTHFEMLNFIDLLSLVLK
jgi:hypothetical protein